MQKKKKKFLDKAVWDTYNHSSNRIPSKRTPRAFRDAIHFWKHQSSAIIHFHTYTACYWHPPIHTCIKVTNMHKRWKTDCFVSFSHRQDNSKQTDWLFITPPVLWGLSVNIKSKSRFWNTLWKKRAGLLPFCFVFFPKGCILLVS